MTEQLLPTVQETTFTRREVLIDNTGAVQGQDVVQDSTNTDAGNTPTFRMRAGNVLVLRTSTGRYVEANDTNGDTNTPASVSALETADADWQSTTITANINGGPDIAVVLGAGDDTDAEVVTALNANAVFAANLVADESGGVVRIRTLEGGSNTSLLVNSTLATAYGADGASAGGTSADYKVAADQTDLQDSEGVAINGITRTWDAGFFDESQLINLTGEARAVLAQRGSRFG